LLKNLALRGSRHNGGHTTLLPLIYLTILPQNIPCAMVLRLVTCSPRCTGLVSHRRLADRHLRGLIPALGDQDHTVGSLRSRRPGLLLSSSYRAAASERSAGSDPRSPAGLQFEYLAIDSVDVAIAALKEAGIQGGASSGNEHQHRNCVLVARPCATRGRMTRPAVSASHRGTG